MFRTLVAAIALVSFSTSAQAQVALPKQQVAQQAVPRPISVADLKGRVLGTIGVPLGKVVTIVGVAEFGFRKGYGGGNHIRVMRVNGQPLEKPVEVSLETEAELVDQSTYEFRAYEHGYFVGITDDDQYTGPATQGMPYGLHTKLIVVQAGATGYATPLPTAPKQSPKAKLAPTTFDANSK